MAETANSPIIEILCVLPRRPSESMESGALQYAMPFEKAREKILQLLEAVRKGEVEYFAVNLREEEVTKKKK
ncbi:MAG: hypothetical protein QXR44_01600 [Thermoproteota archaeon]